jgi:tRNA threonylcarbamoyladenosine biosynthesis protein TsaE
VTSPTFTIGQRYAGRVPVSHLDLYRLGAGGVEGEDPALLADYLTPDAIAFVEWPEAVEPALGSVKLRIEIRHAGGDRRELVISP